MLWQQILNTKPTTSAQPLWQKIINNAGQSLTQGAGNVVPLWQKIRGFTREKIDQPIESKLSSFTGMPEQQVKKISEVGTMLYGSTAPLKITRTLPKLIQEAKGFKSADEFIKGNNKNPTVLFRGIKKNEGVQGRMGETWATSDFDTAQRYAGKDGKVIQIPKPDNIKGGYVIENNTRQFQGKIKPTGNEVVITHSQLKDIWNKAHKKPKYLNPKTIHPDDQQVMIDFIDNVRLRKEIDPRIEELASIAAERYGLKMSLTRAGLANKFDNILDKLKNPIWRESAKPATKK